MAYELFILLLCFELKHFFADFILQNQWMVEGKAKAGYDWLLPLCAHCGVHGVLCLAVLLIWSPSLWPLCFFDVGCHFLMDRIKASPKLLGRWKFTDHQFWNCFGFDQMIHRLTGFFIICFAV